MTNWYNNGFETAKGTIGTGWLAFGKPEAEELLKENNISTFKEFENSESFIDKIETYVTDWRSTEQWNFEVGKHMPKQLIKNELNDKWLDAQSDWIQGYSDYAYSYIKNFLNNLLGICPICDAWLKDCLIRDSISVASFDCGTFDIVTEAGDDALDEGIYCNECNAVISTDEEELKSLIKGELVKTKEQIKLDTVNYYNRKINIYKSIIKDFNKLANKNNKK